MNNQKISKAGICFGLMSIITIVFCILVFNLTETVKTETSTYVEIKDGTANTPAFGKNSITIDKSGDYVIFADWWPDEDPCFVTAFIVTDKNNETVYATSGNKLHSESKKIHLEKGEYEIEYRILGAREEYYNFAREFGKDTEPMYFDFQKVDGTYKMDYAAKFEYQSAWFFPVVFIGLFVIISLAAVVIISKLKTVDGGSRKYDERQVAAQGVGYKYGFITAAGWMIILGMLHFIEVDIIFEPSFECFLGFIISSAVALTVFIIKDAYFAINDNRNSIVGILIACAIINLAVSVANIMHGEFLENGKIGFHGINLVCGLFIVYILMVMFIKKRMEAAAEE